MNIYKLAQEPHVPSVPTHMASHPSEETQPDDLCIIHIPQSLSTCYFLSSPSFCSSMPVQARRWPLDD